MAFKFDDIKSAKEKIIHLTNLVMKLKWHKNIAVK
jgi:hypothetical protein